MTLTVNDAEDYSGNHNPFWFELPFYRYDKDLSLGEAIWAGRELPVIVFGNGQPTRASENGQQQMDLGPGQHDKQSTAKKESRVEPQHSSHATHVAGTSDSDSNRIRAGAFDGRSGAIRRSGSYPNNDILTVACCYRTCPRGTDDSDQRLVATRTSRHGCEGLSRSG